MSEIEAIIKDLVQKLNRWAREYYQNDAPSVSDQEYDAAYNQLLKLEAENPQFILSDSPTQKVGSKLDTRFEKIKHKHQMLSLGNAYSHDDVLDFDKQIKRQLNISHDIEYVTELKIDGLSISLLYNNKKLIKALTRGDGTTGEDVTHNVLMIKDIPHVIDFAGEIEFRGEVYMPHQVFNELNNNGAKLANPRNAAAGTLRQLDSSIAKKRNLASFIYAIPNPLEHDLISHAQVLVFIKKQGFATNDQTSFAKNITEAISYLESYVGKRQEYGYDVDGIVIKVNDIKLWEDIGFTVKAPKFMIAYKFPEEIGQSELTKIFPTIGRTGRVTYNARIKPLRLGGSTVTAATLHNADYVREININVGDIVKVKKAAEIIPKVLGVAIKHNNEPWQEWVTCPACEHKLVRFEGEVDQYCVNDDCLQKNIAKLEHFTSRRAMEIEHLSSQTLQLFLNEGLITNIPSIFELPNKRAEMLMLPGFKDKSVSNLIKAIEKAKKQDLGRFIFALGIRHVGEKLAKVLASRFGSLESVIQAKKEDLESIRDFGEKVTESIVAYFADEANVKMLSELIDHGINFNEIALPVSNKLQGLTFVITGVLSQPRDYFKNMIEQNGGNVSTSVSQNTSYLLAGESAGSKLTKAQDLEVKILNEVQFKEMIGVNHG